MKSHASSLFLEELFLNPLQRELFLKGWTTVAGPGDKTTSPAHVFSLSIQWHTKETRAATEFIRKRMTVRIGDAAVS